MWLLILSVGALIDILALGLWAKWRAAKRRRRDERGGMVDLTGHRPSRVREYRVPPRLTPYSWESEHDFVTDEDVID